MAHLILVSEPKTPDAVARRSDVERGEEEQRPLLRNEEVECGTPPCLQEGAKVTNNYSLIPNASFPAQVKIHYTSLFTH